MVNTAPKSSLNKIAGYDRAERFMNELLDSVETLSGIAESFGPQTLADLLYLHSAIMTGSFIDRCPEDSFVLIVVHSLPSSEEWGSFIKDEYMSGAESEPSHGQHELKKYRVRISRNATRFADFEVVADSEEAAGERVLSLAGDVEFSSEADADYDVESVELIEASETAEI